MADIIEKGWKALLVSVANGTPVHQGYVPEKASLPAYTYTLIDDRRPVTYDSFAGPGRARLQVSAHAKTYPVARTLAEAIRESLIGHSGTYAAIAIQGIFDEGMVALHESDPTVGEAQSDSPEGMHSIHCDFSVHYSL